MTTERLNALQAELTHAMQQIAEWSAIKLRLEGQIKEWNISTACVVAEAFTGWMPNGVSHGE